MQDTSTELEHVEAKPPDIARPIISPDEAEKMVKDLRTLIARILVENKHYQKFRGKDVLLKAGAEELGKFFGLSSRYEDLIPQQVEVEDKDGKMLMVWSASVKCSVSNQAGRVLAESYGFYSGDERRKRDGHIDRQPANTIVKMAQKRAYVGAILTATGTSELFTQDVEDADAAAPAATPDRVPSDAEKNALCRLFAQKGGRSLEEAQAWYLGMGLKGESFLWLSDMAVRLIQKPDAGPAPTGDAIRTEPELPAEPGVLEPDSVEHPADPDSDDDVPF